MKLKINKVIRGNRRDNFDSVVIDIGTYDIIETCCSVFLIYVPDEDCIAVVDYNPDTMKIKKEVI